MSDVTQYGLPANVSEVELLLMGAIFEQPRRLWEVRSILSADDFFLKTCAVSYAEHVALDDDARLLEVIEGAEKKFLVRDSDDSGSAQVAQSNRIREIQSVVAASMAEGGRIGKFADRQRYIDWATSIEINTPSMTDFVGHARAIADMARVRRLEDTCRRIAHESRSTDDPSAFLARAIEEVASISIHLEEETTRAGIKDVIVESFQQLRLDAEDRQNGIVRTVPTGFRELDEMTNGGMRSSELWVLAGRPGAGKTALSLNVATAAAGAGHGVLYYSLEMGRKEINDRMIAAESSVLLGKLRRAELHADDWGHLTNAASYLSGLPILVDWQSGIPLHQLRSRAKRDVAAWQSRFKGSRLRLVVVDYLQKITTPHLPRTASREQQVAEIARGLKDLAKDLDVTVLALAQMGREADKRPGTPMLSDLRESGVIEAEANLVAFMTSEGKNSRRPVDVHVVKQRDGSPCTIRLDFDGSCVRFFDQAAALARDREKSNGMARSSPRHPRHFFRGRRPLHRQGRGAFRSPRAVRARVRRAAVDRLLRAQATRLYLDGLSRLGLEGLLRAAVPRRRVARAAQRKNPGRETSP